MAPRKPPTTIGKDLIEKINSGTGEITDTEVLAAVEARKTAAKKPAKKVAAPRKRATRKAAVPAPDEAWDRQPDESSPAFEAFVIYREMGATRSLQKVARELSKSTTLLKGWSAKHSWQIRVSAYDKFLDREWVLEKRERQRKAARRNADMAAQAMDLVADRIAQMVKHFDFSDEDYDKERPPALDVLDLRRLVESLGKLERLALDAPTENVQVTGKDGGPVQIDYTKLTDEERYERLKHLRDEADRRIAAVGGGTPA